MKATDEQKIIAAKAIGQYRSEDHYFKLDDGDHFYPVWEIAWELHISEMWKWLAENTVIAHCAPCLQTGETVIHLVLDTSDVENSGFVGRADTLAYALILAICAVDQSGKEKEHNAKHS